MVAFGAGPGGQPGGCVCASLIEMSDPLTAYKRTALSSKITASAGTLSVLGGLGTISVMLE